MRRRFATVVVIALTWSADAAGHANSAKESLYGDHHRAEWWWLGIHPGNEKEPPISAKKGDGVPRGWNWTRSGGNRLIFDGIEARKVGRKCGVRYSQNLGSTNPFVFIGL